MGSKAFGIYLIYILWVISIEWINYVFTLLGADTIFFNVAEIISLFLLFVCLFKNRHYLKTESISLSPELSIGIILILLYGCFISVYPDKGFDTFNYHLIAQKPEFRNYFDGHYFGYGHFQVWGFRLGDRLFYNFRVLLGFRMGTILNTIVLTLAYTQICQLLDMITEKSECNLLLRIFANKLVWAIAILLYTQSILMFGSYYVDILAIPVGLEILRLLILTFRKKNSFLEIAYFALLNGIWLGFKLTNIVYVFPCVLLFLFYEIKKFKLKHWCTTIFLGMYPFAIYLIHNFACTGNPFFPYYNKLFKSPYYPLVNFKDGRWGGITFFEKLFWILYAFIKPDYRQCEIPDSTWSVTLMIGLLATIVIIVCNLILIIWHKRIIKNKVLFLLIGLALFSSFLWGMTTGYGRYFIFGRVLWGLIAYCFIVELLNNFRIGKGIALIASIVAISFTAIDLKNSLCDGRNWSWTTWKAETFKKELKHVFNDKILVPNYKVDVDLFVLTNHLSQGMVELFDDDVGVINANYADLAGDMYKSVMNEQLAVTENIADFHIRKFDDIAEYIKILDRAGFLITKFENIDTNMGRYQIVSIEPSVNKINTCWVSGSELYEVFVSDWNNQISLSFMAGRYYDWESDDPVTLKINVSDGVNEREVSEILVDNVLITKYIVPLELKENENRVIIKAYQSNGELVSETQVNKVFILNTNVY